MRRIAQLGALFGALAALGMGAAPASAACPPQGGYAYESGGPARGAFPNDPLFPRQWGLDQIKAPGAWARGGLGYGAVVAVVDTGVDLQHPDLAGQLLEGADFAAEQCAPGPQDEDGHGTHVAGIVAAATNNGVGVAGTAPAAKILPVRVLDPDGSARLEEIFKGVRFAADQGADVINLSIGDNLPGALFPQASWRATVDYASSRGALVVAAAGNDTLPVCESPSNLANVICVGATDRDGLPAFYSSFPVSPEDGLALRAPGGSGIGGCDEDVWSTVWPGAVQDFRGGCGPKGYEPFAGTSMAAPHVSGLAAILASGGLTNGQIVDCLRRTSSNRGAYDPLYGYGIVNAQSAAASCNASFAQPQAPAAASPPPANTTAPPAPPSSGVAGERAGSDTTAPRIRLALGTSRRARVSRAGRLPVRVRTSEAATIAIRVVSGRLAAAGGRNAITIAKGIVTFTRAGVKTGQLRLTRSGRTMLRQRKSRTVTLLARARDAAGNFGTAAKQARLR